MTAPAGHEVTLGEVSRNVQGIRLDLIKLSDLIRERPDWQDVKRVEDGLTSKIDSVTDKSREKAKTLESADAALEARLGKLEGWGNWATKLALGAIGAALLGGVLVQGA